VIYQGLNEIDGISCTLPAGTFYAFPNISSFGMTSWDFAKYLLQEGKVATIPGSIFGRQGEGHLRLSFAADTARLEEALFRIKKATSLLRRVKLVPKP
jgi:aspartate/methionine/tyrosine aminotransferase